MAYPPAGSLFGYRDRLLFLMPDLRFQIQNRGIPIRFICIWATPQWTQVYHLLQDVSSRLTCVIPDSTIKDQSSSPLKTKQENQIKKEKKPLWTIRPKGEMHGQNVIWEVKNKWR